MLSYGQLSLPPATPNRSAIAYPQTCDDCIAMLNNNRVANIHRTVRLLTQEMFESQ